MAIREQMVILQPEPITKAIPTTLLHSDQDDSDSLLAENINLRRQLKILEMNLLSMKKSLQKAETINAELSRQIKFLQKGPVTHEKPKHVDKTGGIDQKDVASKVIPIYSLEERRQKMGRKIKEFFINNA
jgi:hypothetical protein